MNCSLLLSVQPCSEEAFEERDTCRKAPLKGSLTERLPH